MAYWLVWTIQIWGAAWPNRGKNKLNNPYRSEERGSERQFQCHRSAKTHNWIQTKQIERRIFELKNNENCRKIQENQLYYGLFYPNDLFHVKHGGRSSVLFHVKQNVVNWLCFTKTEYSKFALFHVKQRPNERISFKTLRSAGNDKENQLFHVKHWSRRLVRIICWRKCTKQAMRLNRSRSHAHQSAGARWETLSDCFCQLFEKKDQLFHVKRKKRGKTYTKRKINEPICIIFWVFLG